MVGVGEMLVSAVIKEVFSKLSSAIWEEIGMLKDFEDDMMEMKKIFKMVGAVLNDAEKRSVKDKAVCLWLKELKFIAYDIEDMMCDFESKIPMNNGDGWREKLYKIIHSSKLAMARYTLNKEMKKMRKQLAIIALRHSQFNLNIRIGSDNEDAIKQRETFAYLEEENVIVGREAEKEKIISWLLNGFDEVEPSIVSIVGIAGLGKTTLAKMIYNDERVKTYFVKQAWVYVSMEFDLKKIGESIISEIRGTERSNMDTLQNVFRCIRNDLDCKFLIVLDDVWCKDGDNLRKLKFMLACGSKGSKIIVTTRTENVATQMGANLLHYLEPLRDDDCWELVKKRLFGYNNHGDRHSALEGVNLDIVNRCDGIPLVANALGSLIRVMGGINAWSGMRDSNIWVFVDDESHPETKVLNWLKLSYYHMPSYLKECFAYCAIFPKGFEINKNKLIHHWIAMGYIKQSHENLEPEKIGERYIESFLGMSFFQSSTGGTYIYMHDLVHDLAKSIVGDEMLVLDSCGATNAGSNDKYCRYVVVSSDISMSMTSVVLPIKVRALHFHGWITDLPESFFSHTRCLRVLDDSERVSAIPKSVFRLNQLRYISACLTGIEDLSKIISYRNNLFFLDITLRDRNILSPIFSNLQNMRYLKIEDCFVKIIPESIGNLKMLQHLEIISFTLLKSIPKSITKLSKLLILELSYCPALVELPETLTTLVNLEHLNLSGCENLREFPENLGGLYNLRVLNLSNCWRIELLPSSIGGLVKLEILNLKKCTSLKDIPESFGNLSKIQELNLEYCNSLNCLPSNISSLTNLKKLKCNEKLWERLLESLSFNNVAHLVNLQNLPVFIVRNETSQSGINCSNIVNLRHLNRVSGSLRIQCLEKVLESEEAKKASLCNKTELDMLELEWNTSSKYESSCSDEKVLEKLQPHRQLKSFSLIGYRATKLPGWLVDMSSLPYLVYVNISNLPRLECLPAFGQLENLEILVIENLPEVRRIDEDFFRDGPVFMKLRLLKLYCMPHLEECLFPLENKIEWILPNLKKINIHECPKLRVKPCLLKCEQISIDWGNLVLNTGEKFIGALPCRKLSITFERETFNGSEVFQVFGKLEELKLKYFREMVAHLPGIRFLTILKSLRIYMCYDKALPEWLGDLTSLQDLKIYDCNDLEILPESMQNMISLKKLDIWNCNDILFVRCSVDDKMKIAHIPHVSIETGDWGNRRRLNWDRTDDLHPSSSNNNSNPSTSKSGSSSTGFWTKTKEFFSKKKDE